MGGTVVEWYSGTVVQWYKNGTVAQLHLKTIIPHTARHAPQNCYQSSHRPPTAAHHKIIIPHAACKFEEPQIATDELGVTTYIKRLLSTGRTRNQAAHGPWTLDRGPMLLGPRTSVAGPWTSAAHRGRGLWHESRLQDVRLPKFLLPHSHVQSPKFVEHPAQLHRRRRPKFMFPHSLGCFGRQRRHALKKYWCPRSVSTPTNRMTL